MLFTEQELPAGPSFPNNRYGGVVINVCRTTVLVLCLLLPSIPFTAATADRDKDKEASVSSQEPDADIRWLQKRLRQRGYLFAKATGVYDKETRFAVWALRKSHGMRPANVVDAAVLRKLDQPGKIRPLVKGGAANRVEIDLGRQLLTVYRRNKPVLISHASTGAGVRFCQGGRCRKAITPVGDFRVYKRAGGWTKGPLGSMYNSLYFVGGVAMHGSRKVPSWPGSHGCVRLPMSVADRLWKIVGIGEPVHVRKGRKLHG